MINYHKILVCVATIILLLVAVNPVWALLLGFAFAACKPKIEPSALQKLSKLLMGLAIVALGFNLDLSNILTLTKENLLVTISGIGLTMTLAWYFGRLINLSKNISVLLGAGTAICGASAIAALSSAIKSKPEQTSVALAVVLIFNSIALILFPFIGAALGLSFEQFGVWAGLAIHDTSSVVGAALSYSKESLEVATPVKLARAIWIAPLVIIYSRLISTGTKINVKTIIPWFIWGFLLASGIATFFDIPEQLVSSLKHYSAKIFSLAIFLICSAVQISALKQIGLKPLLLGLALWIISAGWSLYFVYLI